MPGVKPLTLVGRLVDAIDQQRDHAAVAGDIGLRDLDGLPTGALEAMRARLRAECRQRWLLSSALLAVIEYRSRA
jgi:hypothetical protein